MLHEWEWEKWVWFTYHIRYQILSLLVILHLSIIFFLLVCLSMLCVYVCGISTFPLLYFSFNVEETCYFLLRIILFSNHFCKWKYQFCNFLFEWLLNAWKLSVCYEISIYLCSLEVGIFDWSAVFHVLQLIFSKD